MTEVPRPLLSRVLAQMHSREFARFLLVGVWNTVFGFAVYAVLNFLLSRRFPEHGYLAAGLLAALINITVAFLGYKWVVFRTSGNYLREWIRTVGVYGVSIAVTTLLLPMLVYLLEHAGAVSHQGATYLGAFLLTIMSALWSFFGNKNFSFKKKSSASE